MACMWKLEANLLLSLVGSLLPQHDSQGLNSLKLGGKRAIFTDPNICLNVHSFYFKFTKDGAG